MRMALSMVLATALAVVAWGSAQAQPIDGDPCRDACEEAHEQCIESCGDHNDPIECDGECRDAREDCLSECR